MSVAPTARRWLLTGGVAAITVTGSLYGAGLKIKQDFKEVRHFPSLTVKYLLLDSFILLRNADLCLPFAASFIFDFITDI